MAFEGLVGSVRRTLHRGDDDLLSAGLGLAGLAGLPVAFADAVRPTPEELRRRAIQTGWKGLADFGPLGGFARLYGSVPDVPGREYSAFARIPGARQPHRVLCQIPDAFDARARCLVVAPSSGSRGVYGAMAVGGAWGLGHGCAVVYTDKGTGSGYFDCAGGTGVALDGTRVEAGRTLLEFQPQDPPRDAGIAVKHAHSGDHPEADWGRHVLQAVEFGLAMLGEAFPAQAPFTPANTRVIAVGISNGGAAVLQAAGADREGWLDAVLALEPNVDAPGSRALYDYASEAAVWLPIALTAASFGATPFARTGSVPAPAWLARGASLHERGLLASFEPAAQAAEALDRVVAAGWELPALATAASSTAFDLWRAIAATYASAYLRAPVGAMPCGFAFGETAVPGLPPAVVRAGWWADGTGIPPDRGVGLFGGLEASADPTAPGALALRALWEGSDAQAQALHAAVAQLTVRMPRAGLPMWLVHGAEDGLVPAAFSSDPYVRWLRGEGRAPRYWRVPHAQHFDAFLQVPGFGDRYVPLLAYGEAAFARLYGHVVRGEALPDAPSPRTRPRGAAALDASALDLPR